MKQFSMNMLLFIGCIIILNFISHTDQSIPVQGINDLPTIEQFLSDEDQQFILDHADTVFAYIPDYLKFAVKNLHQQYPDLHEHIDISLFLTDTRNIAPQEIIEKATQDLICALAESDIQIKAPQDNTFAIAQQYIQDLKSGDARIILEPLDDVNGQTRARCKTVNNLWVRNALTAGSLNVSCNATD